MNPEQRLSVGRSRHSNETPYQDFRGRQAADYRAGEHIARIVHAGPDPGDADRERGDPQNDAPPPGHEQSHTEGDSERGRGVVAGHRHTGCVRNQLMNVEAVEAPGLAVEKFKQLIVHRMTLSGRG
jgi:hypothetical protein